MAILVANNNETGLLSSYTTIEGTPTMVAPPATNTVGYTGSFVLACPMVAPDAASHAGRETWTNGLNAYVRVALRVNVPTPPTATLSLQAISMHDSAFGNDMAAIWLAITTTPTASLQLKSLPGVDVGASFNISVDTWYIVELKTLSNGAAGTAEMRVDGVVRATGTADVGTAVGLVRLSANAGIITGAATVYYDILEVRDDVYPGVPITGMAITASEGLTVGDTRLEPG